MYVCAKLLFPNHKTKGIVRGYQVSRIDFLPLAGVPPLGLTVDLVVRLVALASVGGDGSVLLGVEGFIDVTGNDNSISSCGGGERDPELNRSSSRALRLVAVFGVSAPDSSRIPFPFGRSTAPFRFRFSCSFPFSLSFPLTSADALTSIFWPVNGGEGGLAVLRLRGCGADLVPLALVLGLEFK